MAPDDEKGKTPGTFCALAWLHRFTNAKGEIQVCCSSEEWNNAVLNGDGTAMNIRDGLSDEQIMNSGFMKDLRRQMLAGRWPDLCQRCLVTEKTGGVSRRNQENEHFRARIPDLLESTGADGAIPVDVRSADYRLGNLCNLACRMCNPDSSSRWLQTWSPAEAELRREAAGVRTGQGPFEWYRDPRVLEVLKKQLPTLEHLHFAGGEPLIVPEMLAILRDCVDRGLASRIELTYNTNITKIPQELKSLWPRFRSVRLFCSVDAFGELNDFIRYPSSWREIDRNLRDLDRNFEAYGLAQVLIMTTVQVYNVFRLGELYEYLFENMTRVSQLPNLVDLHHPVYYSTQILTPPLKKAARRGLEELLERASGRVDRGLIRSDCAGAVETLRSSINFLDLEDRRDAAADFIRVVERKDALCGRSVFELLPELAALKGEAPRE